MVWVSCDDKINHFRHISECPYDSEPESIEHLEMKKNIFELVSKYNNTKFVFLEKIIGNRKTDIYIQLPNTQRVVIECQCSLISQREILERIADYNKMGYAIIWILGTKNFARALLEYEEEYIEGNPHTIFFLNSRKIERLLHKIYFGKIYYYNAERSLFSVRFKRGSGKHINKIENYILKCTENKRENAYIAQFGGLI